MRRLPYAKPRKKKKERKVTLTRKTPVKSRNDKRRKSEWVRAYHSRARVLWIKSLPCCVCSRGPCDNAHTATGGTGRKADYHTIAPLCSGLKGHHRELHLVGVETFERYYGVNLRYHAIETEELWQRLQEAAA